LLNCFTNVALPAVTPTAYGQGAAVGVPGVSDGRIHAGVPTLRPNVSIQVPDRA
jgi:hypothetical protein